MSDVYVLGVDMIKFGRFPERTVPDLGAEAAGCYFAGAAATGASFAATGAATAAGSAFGAAGVEASGL